MPFIVRCEQPHCQKFNLVEDEMRGQTVKCLICTAPIRAEPNSSMIRVCPRCSTKLRVPSEAAGQRVQCPKCQAIFA